MEKSMKEKIFEHPLTALEYVIEGLKQKYDYDLEKINNCIDNELMRLKK